MELRHLRYFYAVAEHLSFAKAAEAIHISQPPLSRQIQELEEEIGTLLFIRSNNKIELTAAGEYLMAEARRILDNADEVLRSCKRIGDGYMRPIRIGATSSFADGELPGLLRVLQKEHPEFRTVLSVLPTEDQEEALRRGSLDFGFVRHWAKTDGLVFEKLGEDRLVLCCPKRLYSGDSLADFIEAVSDSPLVTVDENRFPGLTSFIESILDKLGLRSVPGHECPDGETLLRMVEEGLGWTLMTKSFVVRARAKVTVIELPDSISHGILYGSGPLSPPAEQFLLIVRRFISRK